MAIADLFERIELVRGDGTHRYSGSAVDTGRNRLDLVSQGHFVGVEQFDPHRGALLEPVEDGSSQLGGPAAAVFPMGGDDSFDAVLVCNRPNGGNLVFAIRVKTVDRNHRLQTEPCEVCDMAREVRRAGTDSSRIRFLEVALPRTAVQLESPNGAYQHSCVGTQAGLAALDVEELLRPEIRSEARFGHHYVRQPESGARCDDRVAAVGNIGEGSAMNEGEVAFEGLHDVRLQSVAQQGCHRPVDAEIPGRDRFAVPTAGDDDAA